MRVAKINYFIDDFIVMGSDGIFDYNGVDEICDRVMYYFRQDSEVCEQVVAEKLIDEIRASNFAKSKQCDNLSLVIIFLNRGYNRAEA